MCPASYHPLNACTSRLGSGFSAVTAASLRISPWDRYAPSTVIGVRNPRVIGVIQNGVRADVVSSLTFAANV